MSKTVTKSNKLVGALHSVEEDLATTGIQEEHIYLDDDAKQVKVMFPAVIESKILEISGRYQPVD